MEDSKNIYQQVHDHYGSLARGTQPVNSGAIAKAFGYSEEELSSIPADANLGVSCGTPLAIASLREGETVIDLGSGAGLDVFLASKKVGTSGRAIGVDMNKDMLARARQNQSKSPEASNVSFVEAKITSIPLDDSIADCLISNCVINLVPECEKPQVFAEMARLLKPGGRVAVSDILARKPLPAGLRESVALYVGCVAGASTKEDYTGWLKETGFVDILIVDAMSDLNVYIDKTRDAQAENQAALNCCGASARNPAASGDAKSCCARGSAAGICCSKANGDTKGCCDSSCCAKTRSVKDSANSGKHGTMQDEFNLTDVDLNDWAGSFKIFAVKA